MKSARPVLTVRLWRENRHVEPSVLRDVGDVVLGASLLFVLLLDVVLVLR